LLDELPHFLGLPLDLATHGENHLGLSRLVHQPSRRFQLVNRLFEAMAVDAIGKDAQQFAPLRPRFLDHWLGLHGHGVADLDVTVLASGADFEPRRAAAQQAVYRFGHLGMESETITVVNLNQHIESRRRFAFQYSLLCAAPPRLFIT
jgi:hypothetical protein